MTHHNFFNYYIYCLLLLLEINFTSYLFPRLYFRNAQDKLTTFIYIKY